MFGTFDPFFFFKYASKTLDFDESFDQQVNQLGLFKRQTNEQEDLTI